VIDRYGGDGKSLPSARVPSRAGWHCDFHGGDFKSKADRVLTNSEYAEHYGHNDPAQIDWQKPLPWLFDSLLMGRPVLFLGSSLEADRTVRILGASAVRHPDVGHYALLGNPKDDASRHQRARALSNVGIRPLWFPDGRFDLIGPFLTYLTKYSPGTRNPKKIALQYKRIKIGIKKQWNARFHVLSQSALEPQRIVGDPPDRAEYFRGRQDQLQEVSEHMISPSTRLVSLVGPSGIGKTALAVRLLTDVAQNR
jgi:hypothetical protein